MTVQSRSWLVALAVVCVALNLRPALAAIGPLLDMIEAATGLSHTQAGLLTTLPVFAMGFVGVWGMRIRQGLDERRGICVGLALVFIACAGRAVAMGTLGLVATALVAGVGIAWVQVVVPAFIKRRFAADAGRVFALYTTGIMAGAAFAAASAAGLASRLGWTGALAVWAVPALLGMPVWWLATRGATAPVTVRAAAAEVVRPAFWRHRRAWALMAFFGISTGAYTLVLAWLPPYYTGLGWHPAAAGFLLGGLTLAEVIVGLAVSAWIDRWPDRRKPLAAALAALIVGLVCLLVAPLSLALPACLLLGIGIGALFPLSLIVTLDHIDDPAQAGMLTAFVQGGGYMLASLMPLLAGVLRDRFADLSHAWLVMLVGALALLVLCTRFAPASYHRMQA
ncbi:MFS transporter [Comamonas serinivorans]|uniref:MFS transporter n=1 Tax=Comamonas serinivorans TaxID=1082851 RepID=A0A1Y0EN95_9BURK|nr:MFS transporter [Comamonas serinivorans]ARU04779.1 MFS transporter [Comamonas serinivorans]